MTAITEGQVAATATAAVVTGTIATRQSAEDESVQLVTPPGGEVPLLSWRKPALSACGRLAGEWPVTRLSHNARNLPATLAGGRRRARVRRRPRGAKARCICPLNLKGGMNPLNIFERRLAAHGGCQTYVERARGGFDPHICVSE